MDDMVTQNARVYTDIQGLNQLKYNTNSTAVKKEVAQQFEAILMQMVLSSMRSANKAFSSGLFGSSQMEMYQDIFDKQLSLTMSKSGVGFADMIEKNLNHTGGISQSTPVPSPVPSTVERIPESYLAQPIPGMLSTPDASGNTSKNNQDAVVPADAVVLQSKKSHFNSPEEFIKDLWPAAKLAAGLIGASPEILLAQAALETNWGKNVIQRASNVSTHNLFNIKADGNWRSGTATVDSLEQENGVLVKERSSFRSYETFMDSFMDYVKLLKQNSRYSNSLNKATNPEQFVNELQKAGYATDPNYADKIMRIFSSHSFQALVSKIKSIT